MAVIEPLRQDVQDPQKLKRNSRALRLWHWADVIIISGSLITVLINSTLLDRSAAGGVKSSLHDTTITIQQAQNVTHALSDKVWGVHIWFGYFLAAFLIFRVVVEIFQRRNQKFFGKLRKATSDYFVEKKDIKLARHEFAVKTLYLLFYILLVIMVLTGLTLVFKSQLHLPRNISHTVRSIHGFCMYLILAFIIVHIVGVILAERSDSKGIVSDMINGGAEQD